MGAAAFPRRKRVIFRKLQEIKGFRGDVLVYFAQGNPQIDAKIAKKHRFRTGTSPYFSPGPRYDPLPPIDCPLIEFDVA